MQWSEFGPYVMPHVTGCPEPVLIHHARLATIEWCRKTQCWIEWLDDLATDGLANEIEIDPSSNRLANKVKTVEVDGIEWGLVDPDYGITLASQESSERFCYTDDGKILNVYPLQAAGVKVRIRSTLTPTVTAITFDDALIDYLQDIAEGTIASIQRIPGQDFSNKEDSAIHETLFRSRIQTIALKVGRGRLAAKMHRLPRFV
jgi:hypothetical protein